jgi:hypothetical protein
MIWIDGQYDMVGVQEQIKYSRRSGVDFGPVDYVKYAEAFGATGLRIQHPDEIAPTLRRAFRQQFRALSTADKGRNSMATVTSTNHPDVVLVGAGIMSATLAVILKELDPRLKIDIYEVLGSEAQESSNAWNNAGTGHAALCELNYTPQKSDGSIDISKALEVNTEFDLSRQLWAYLVKKGAIADPQSFIHPVPHCSFVRGSENVAFLKTLRGAHCSSPLSGDGTLR